MDSPHGFAVFVPASELVARLSRPDRRLRVDAIEALGNDGVSQVR